MKYHVKSNADIQVYVTQSSSNQWHSHQQTPLIHGNGILNRIIYPPSSGFFGIDPLVSHWRQLQSVLTLFQLTRLVCSWAVSHILPLRNFVSTRSFIWGNIHRLFIDLSLVPDWSNFFRLFELVVPFHFREILGVVYLTVTPYENCNKKHSFPDSQLPFQWH